MNKQEHFHILMIVVVVGFFALAAIFSFAIKMNPSEGEWTDTTTIQESKDLTGAAVRGYAYEKSCYADYYNDPNKKGAVRIKSVYNNPETGRLTKVAGGTTYSDQCYTDVEDMGSYDNNGRYLRQHFCADDFTLDYQWFDCGENRCQFGACVGDYRSVN
jgi:hypothetical protein